MVGSTILERIFTGSGSANHGYAAQLERAVHETG
jgi:hypothetical protein